MFIQHIIVNYLLHNRSIGWQDDFVLDEAYPDLPGRPRLLCVSLHPPASHLVILIHGPPNSGLGQLKLPSSYLFVFVANRKSVEILILHRFAIKNPLDLCQLWLRDILLQNRL